MFKKTILKQQFTSAFTLLELLIVMVILALLLGIGLMSFGTVREQSRDSSRKQNLAHIAKALELYNNDFGFYPTSTDDGKIMACQTDGRQICEWGEEWLNSTDNTLYMILLPKDPIGTWHYFYRRITENSYYLFARLENEKDPLAAVETGNPAFYVYTNCTGENDSCNYAIKSSNVNEEPPLVY